MTTSARPHLKDELATQIRAIALLRDPALRDSVLATWAAALEASPYASLAEVPQSPVMLHRPLSLHVNEVNDLTLQFIDVAAGYGLALDREVALATAILHDVDKPLIFRRDPTGTAFAHANGTELDDHGRLGADLAAANGVPQIVADMVRRHSPFASDGLPGTREGTVVHYADFLANDLACHTQGAAPIHSSVRYVHKTRDS